VNSYRPENPLASNVGLPNGGRPDVVVQDSRGTEVGRFAVEPQPAQVIAAIRKADPSYKPGGGKSSTSLPEWMVIVGLLAGWAVFAGLNNRKAAPIG
jgi:hypothetical protein